MHDGAAGVSVVVGALTEGAYREVAPTVASRHWTAIRAVVRAPGPLLNILSKRWGFLEPVKLDANSREAIVERMGTRLTHEEAQLITYGLSEHVPRDLYEKCCSTVSR